jgi:hypothetical protein
MTAYASRGGAKAGSTYRAGHPANGYNFGHARYRKPGVTRPAPDPVPESLPCLGYEVLGASDKLIATYACFLDACDRLRVMRGPGKIVRRSDRALLKSRQPHRGRP